MPAPSLPSPSRRLCAALLAGALGLLPPAASRAAGPPNPGESVLIIYDDVTTYGVQLANAVSNALLAVTPAPTISTVVLHSGSVGIYSSLLAQTGKTDLSSWCQVWDLRFRDDRNNIAYTGPNQEDVITFAGANNDTLLYTNYLNQNGHLFLQGEHHDFYIRDQNLFALINAVAKTPISSSQTYAGFNAMNSGAIGGFPATPNAFNTSWNNLVGGTVNARFPGGLEQSYAGSGQPIGANFTSSFYSTGASKCNTAYAWMTPDLKTNGGRLVVNFESNAFCEPTLVNGTSNQWLQNVYQLLSGCYKYSLTKTFSPTTLNVGDAGTFTLCYSNSGATPLSNVPLWDTMPACLSYVSDSLGSPSVSGQVYSWTIPSVAAGASACVTVNFTVSSFAGCP